MAFDNHPNLASGTILTPPTPASSGTTFILFPGDGSAFLPNMPVTLCPSDTQPDRDNAEIGYLTAVDGDELTITRHQEGTSALPVEAGWKVYGTITRKTITDIEEAVDGKADASVVGAHTARTDNPHSVTKAQVGLSNVDNTSDAEKPVSVAQAVADALRVSKAGDTMTGPLQVTAPGGASISGLPLGRASAANTGLNLVGSFQGGEDSGAGIDTTARLNIYAYQRAQTGSFGETIRNFMMRADAKAMVTWYLPRAGYNLDRTPDTSQGWSPVWWVGAHNEANDHNGYHNHGSIEVPDSNGALQTRLEIPFVDQSTWQPGDPWGVDITNIRTNLADFTVRATHGVLRVGGGNAYNKDILLSASSDRTGTGERWKIRADSTTESGSNAGTDFNIRRHADDGSFMGTALFIRRSDGNVAFGASSASSARLTTVWSANGNHGFYAAPSSNVGNGAAFASSMQNASARVVDHRVVGDGNARFAQFADGKMEFGDGTAARDTNLYRTAADTLQTDDNLIAAEPTLSTHVTTKNYVDTQAWAADYLPVDYGYKSWAFDPAVAVNASAVTVGTAYVVRVKIPVATTISTIAVYLSGTPGAGLTNSYVALYQNNSLLTQSTNQSTSWQSTGMKNVSVTPTAVAVGFVDVAFWVGGATTPPSFSRTAGTGVVNGALTGTSIRFASANTGLTTTAPATLGTKTSSGLGHWVAVG